MSDAYLEFLTENAQRRYPFVEDSSGMDLTDVFTLPNDAVLDARGFHRARPELTPRLAAIAGGSASGDADYPATNGVYSLFFECGISATPLRFTVTVPVNNGNWPFQVTVAIADPLYAGIVPAINAGVLQVTIGQGITELAAADRWLFGPRLQLEPALMAQLYLQQVDALRLVHDEGPDDYVSGEVRLQGGYNFDLNQDANVINFEPSPGGGELGRWLGSLADESASRCAGTLMSLNGITATPRGGFTIGKGSGIEIVNLPEQNKIQIKFVSSTAGKVVCGT